MANYLLRLSTVIIVSLGSFNVRHYPSIWQNSKAFLKNTVLHTVFHKLDSDTQQIPLVAEKISGNVRWHEHSPGHTKILIILIIIEKLYSKKCSAITLVHVLQMAVLTESKNEEQQILQHYLIY